MLTKSKLTFLLAAMHFCSTVVVADSAMEVPAALALAFANTPPLADDSWAYTRTENRDGVTWVERFDPSADDFWQLISVGGEQPDAEHQKLAQERFARRMESTDMRVGENDFASLAQPNSWQFLSETDEELIYTYKPAIDDDNRKFHEVLIGKLSIDKATQTVSGFRIYNTKPFRPVAIAKLKKMEMMMKMKFIKDRVVLPQQISVQIVGRAMGLKKINEHQIIEFSNYEQVK